MRFSRVQAVSRSGGARKNPVSRFCHLVKASVEVARVSCWPSPRLDLSLNALMDMDVSWS